MSSSGASWAKLSETVSTTVERCVVSESSPDACLSEKALRGDPGVSRVQEYTAIPVQCSMCTVQRSYGACPLSCWTPHKVLVFVRIVDTTPGAAGRVFCGLVARV